jgi:hypothetical protein
MIDVTGVDVGTVRDDLAGPTPDRFGMHREGPLWFRKVAIRVILHHTARVTHVSRIDEMDSR